MNKNLKYAAAGALGLVAGTAVGFLIRKAQFEKKLAAENTEYLRNMEVFYSEAAERVTSKFEDSAARSLKTGKYATVKDAASVLVPEKVLGLDFEDDNADEFVEDTDILDEYQSDTDNDIIDDYASADEALVQQMLVDEAKETGVDVEAFVEEYRTRMSDTYGGVSFPGQTAEADEEESDIPVLTVPGWVTVRDPNGPYIISIDEYMEDEDSPFTKAEMTYFEGDDTLVDVSNMIIPKINDIVGGRNLDRWGHGTTDPDQVYIRNERLAMDIELTRNESTYTRVILKIIPKDELARSMTKPLKMREGDDN